jgi:hypothetical protein
LAAPPARSSPATSGHFAFYLTLVPILLLLLLLVTLFFFRGQVEQVA